MSIIFGIRAAADQHIEERHLRDLARATERYAPDGTFVAATANVGMGYQPYSHPRALQARNSTCDRHGRLHALL